MAPSVLIQSMFMDSKSAPMVVIKQVTMWETYRIVTEASADGKAADDASQRSERTTIDLDFAKASNIGPTATITTDPVSTIVYFPKISPPFQIPRQTLLPSPHETSGHSQYLQPPPPSPSTEPCSTFPDCVINILSATGNFLMTNKKWIIAAVDYSYWETYLQVGIYWEMRGLLTTKDGQIYWLQHDLDAERTENAILRTNVTETITKAREYFRKKATEFRELEDDYEESQDTVSKLEKANKDLKRENIFTQCKFQNVTDEANGYKETITVLKARNNGLDLELGYAEAKLAKSRTKIQIGEQSQESLAKERDGIISERFKLKENFDHLHNANEDLLQEATTMKKNISELQSQVEHLTAAKTALETSLAEQSKEFSSAKIALEDLLAEQAAEHASKDADFRQELYIAKEKNSRLREENADWKEKNNGLETDFLLAVFNNLKIDSEDGRKALAIIEGKNAGLADENKALKAQLQAQSRGRLPEQKLDDEITEGNNGDQAEETMTGATRSHEETESISPETPSSESTTATGIQKSQPSSLQKETSSSPPLHSPTQHQSRKRTLAVPKSWTTDHISAETSQPTNHHHHHHNHSSNNADSVPKSLYHSNGSTNATRSDEGSRPNPRELDRS